MTDTPDGLTPDHEDDDWGYGSDDHVRALRILLATMGQDWAARDEVSAEIGDCPGCWQAVAWHLATEAAAAYVGPPTETEDGFELDEKQVEGATEFIGEILANILDEREITQS